MNSNNPGTTTLNVLGTNIHFIDKGNGPVLLLIHGLGADSTRWQYNIMTLSEKYRVIAIDLPGFGQSECAVADYSGEYFIAVLKAFLQALNIQKVTLIGNSMGGWLSMLFAKHYPKSVAQLILVAPAFYAGLPKGVTAEQIASSANPQDTNAMRAYLERVLYSPPTSIDEIEKELKAHQQRNRGNAISNVAKSLSIGLNTFSNTQLAELDFPMLIIHGESDGIVPSDASRKLAEKLPNAVFRNMKHAGHWPQLEQPMSFNTLVLDYLQQR